MRSRALVVRIRGLLPACAIAWALGACAESPDAARGQAGSTTASSGGSTSSGTSSGATGGTTGSGGSCPTCQAPSVTGSIANGAIAEASGLAASLLSPGVFFLHNDSGDVPRFFAFDATGLDLGTYDVEGATAIDWESMARGPCASRSCLYLGDIGDNAAQRTSYVIYRVPEPSALGPGPHTIAAEALLFHYPDGSHNAETLLVHPTTGVVTIVTKVSAGASSIYELPMPLTPGVEAALVKKGELTTPSGTALITDGCIHPQGRGVLIRTYTNVFYYPGSPGQSAAEMLAGAPCELPAPIEPQGEAIVWLGTGAGYLTVSEGAGVEVHSVTCTP